MIDFHVPLFWHLQLSHAIKRQNKNIRILSNNKTGVVPFATCRTSHASASSWLQVGNSSSRSLWIIEVSHLQLIATRIFSKLLPPSLSLLHNELARWIRFSLFSPSLKKSAHGCSIFSSTLSRWTLREVSPPLFLDEDLILLWWYVLLSILTCVASAALSGLAELSTLTAILFVYLLVWMLRKVPYRQWFSMLSVVGHWMLLLNGSSSNFESKACQTATVSHRVWLDLKARSWSGRWTPLLVTFLLPWEFRKLYDFLWEPILPSLRTKLMDWYRMRRGKMWNLLIRL